MSTDSHSKADGGGLLPSLGAAHDAVTRFSFDIAVACLAIIIVAFCFEVVARYVFGSPTTWALAVSSYLLLAMIFLALPEMTRTSSHVAITMLIDKLPTGAANVLRTTIHVLGIVGSAVAAWITTDEAIAHFVGDIWTIQSFPIPKWMVSGMIPYGFASAGLYFLRQAIGDPSLPKPEGVGV